jgi:hypothetical protein
MARRGEMGEEGGGRAMESAPGGRRACEEEAVEEGDGAEE